MSNKATVLTAKSRERTGSRYARRLRASGSLPAVVYGHKETPVSITLNTHDTMQVLKRGEKFFELDIDGKREHVLLKDLGYNHLGDEIIHADFARVNLDERVDTKTHLAYVGEPKGLKTDGAILMHPVTELELNCLITNLPDEIEVDVSDLDVGDMIHASEIKLPLDSMEMLTDPDTVVAQIVLKAETPETMEETEVEGETEPEVIGEKPEGDEGEDGEASKDEES